MVSLANKKKREQNEGGSSTQAARVCGAWENLGKDNYTFTRGYGCTVCGAYGNAGNNFKVFTWIGPWGLWKLWKEL